MQEAAIGDACAAVGRVDDGGNFGFQVIPDGVEEIRECGVAGGLWDADSEGGVEVGEVGSGGVVHDAFLTARSGGWELFFGGRKE